MKNKVYRLKKNAHFKTVYRFGKSGTTKKTVLLYKKNEEKINRLGITVSKKIGKSVVRHRIKRLYTEAFRSIQDKILFEGYDLVIIARKGADSLTYHEAVEDIYKLLKRGKLIK